MGYQTCKDAKMESGYQKLALYVNAGGAPTHMARQLPSGNWTSKLGQQEDIEHSTVSEVEGPLYGTAVVFLKRPNANFTGQS
jgi:hypothetical protein